MRKLLLLLLLLLVQSVHATTTTLTGTIKDEQGNPINGTIILQLPVPATDTTTNTAVAPNPVSYRIVNGSILGGAVVPLYDVATLQPQNLYYSARVYDSSGNLVFTGNYAITGASYNLGAAIPTNVTTSNISYVSPAVTNAPNVFCCTQTFQGQIVSTVATGTAPFSIASTTLVPNLDINNLNGVIVSGTPSLNQILTATSATTASWQTSSSGIFGTYTNDTVTGTSASLLVKLTGAPSKVITSTLGDTGGAIGICVSGCGTAGSASISTVGTTSCIFDAATTAGDYVQISAITAGNCHDAGATYPASGQVVGRVLSTNGGGGTYSMALFGIEIKGISPPVVKQAKLGGASCTTGAGTFNTCTSNVTFSPAFADTNYTPVCSGNNPSDPRANLEAVAIISSSVVQVTVVTDGATAVNFADIYCIGVHP